MKKKVLCFLLTLVLAVTPLMLLNPSVIVSALPQEKEDLENRIEEIDAQIAANKQKLEALKDKKENQMEYLDTLENQIETVESKVSGLQTQIESINSQVGKLNTELKQLDNEIKTINSDINQAVKDISEMQTNITSTSDQLAAKLRSSYMNGNESALKILMGSDSLASFLTRLEMMKRTSENDKALILGFRDKVTKLNKTKEKLEKDKVDVSEKINEANEKKALSLEKKSELEKKQKAHDATMSDLEDKYAEAEGIISGLDKSSAEYKKYNSELQREKAEADAEIDRILSEYYATQTTLPVQNNEPTSSQSGGNTPATTKPAGPSYTAKGDWIWPLGNASCYISSPFGYRSASISGNSFHGGTDIAGGGISGKPVYASRAGKVITAVTSDRGYGIYVLIDHGDGYSTLYAHMSARYVSTGDNVSKGQMIGRVGSTGNSTGPHLHFEVRYYGEKKNPMNFVKKP
ncbi:MAG: peptidoglycan DD-metalloendopeptidase family protein [Clostridia bacterium]|nr:peptidoglycan DD-metalloendopeptidase family protein [Clostridia bacterium]